MKDSDGNALQSQKAFVFKTQERLSRRLIAREEMKKHDGDVADSIEYGNEQMPLVNGLKKPSYVFVVVATWIMFVEGMGGIAALAIN